MRPLDNDILNHLNAVCDGEPIHFVGLGAYDFQVAFSDLRSIQTMEKAVFTLRGQTYTWEAGPSAIPVWLLIGQVPTGFEITSPFALRMHMASGDWMEFYCNESPYEALIVDFGLKDGARVLEIF